MMLIYKGYTYTHMTHNTRWYCSKKAGGCRARLKTTSEGQLVQVLESEHNHPPPNLYRAASGKIIKVMQVKNIGPMTNAERQKKYRQKLKENNPEKYNEKRIAHLEKVKENKRKISELTDNEKEQRRRKWRQYSAKYYEKQKK
ncbi:uncharacterized protein LOC123868962 isoform X2 [Maniola jurtina]|uniref:uncharacterized protein LOC123868962 isoform X2 n=1 Tax=Maniola jurtina TaxID=191418 RepID=UPI001E687868|nr:uncharacterized protein LOC123868962 isoform X2 [Maniola jurtina]